MLQRTACVAFLQNLGSDLGRRAALSSEGAPAAELGDKEGNGVEEAVDFSKGGWMWTNDAAAQTQARLNAQKLRPKKCRPLPSGPSSEQPVKYAVRQTGSTTSSYAYH